MNFKSIKAIFVIFSDFHNKKHVFLYKILKEAGSAPTDLPKYYKCLSPPQCFCTAAARGKTLLFRYVTDNCAVFICENTVLQSRAVFFALAGWVNRNGETAVAVLCLKTMLR